MPLTVSTRRTVTTRFGDVRVATAAGAALDLLVITPIGSAWMERALPRGLQDLFTVHVVELPGTGRGPEAPEAASVNGVVTAISEVVATVCPSPPVLFGHSMNGTLALAAAAEVPCLGVVAVTPPAQLPGNRDEVVAYWEAKAEPARRERAEALAAEYNAASDEEQRTTLQEQYGRLGRWYDMDFDPTELDSLVVTSSGWVSSVFDSGATIDWPRLMKAVRVPVLLALGEFDFVAPMTAWTEENTPPVARVEVFHRSGHTPYLEEPAAFMRTISDWTAHLT